jgi:hypothetical protein
MKVVNDNIIDMIALDQQRSQLATDIQSKHHSNKIWDDSFHGKFYGRESEMSQLLEAYRRVSIGRDTNNDAFPSVSELTIVEGETVRPCLSYLF